jgi:hypothetical protein
LKFTDCERRSRERREARQQAYVLALEATGVRMGHHPDRAQLRAVRLDGDNESLGDAYGSALQDRKLLLGISEKQGLVRLECHPAWTVLPRSQFPLQARYFAGNGEPPEIALAIVFFDQAEARAASTAELACSPYDGL